MKAVMKALVAAQEAYHAAVADPLSPEGLISLKAIDLQDKEGTFENRPHHWVNCFDPVVHTCKFETLERC